MSTASLGPVFDRELRNPLEVADIARHNDRALFEGDGRDPEVHLADIEFQGTKMLVANNRQFGERKNSYPRKVLHTAGEAQVDLGQLLPRLGALEDVQAHRTSGSSSIFRRFSAMV